MMLAGEVICPSPMLAGLLPDHVATSELYWEVEPACPYPDEFSTVQDASATRRNSFAAGRLCARAALAALGVVNFPVRTAPRGAPIWPDGVAGSIAHSGKSAIAAACLASPGIGLGIDVECIAAVRPAMWPLLFRDEEADVITALPATKQQHIAAVLFSAKEAFFKAQWPITGTWLEFRDVHCVIAGSHFEIRQSGDRTGTHFFGRHRVCSNSVVTAIMI